MAVPSLAERSALDPGRTIAVVRLKPSKHILDGTKNIIPHAKCGSNNERNVRLLCRRCNLAKRDNT